MNKTVNINLAGIFFHIDEDAYKKLQAYLTSIKNSISYEQGRAEIMQDIEARIAELFQEKMTMDRQVISQTNVEEVIALMGQPEDYVVDDEIFDDEPKQKEKAKTVSKKLFRDTKNGNIAGVSTGLAHYIGVEPYWMHLAWLVLLFFSAGSFAIAYIIFWIFVPEAKTTADKLHMHGKPVNIDNIEKKVKEGFDSMSEKMKDIEFEKYGKQAKNKATSFFNVFGKFVLFCLNVFIKFVGITLILLAGTTLIALFFAFFGISIFGFSGAGWMDYAQLYYDISPIWLISLFGLIVFGIPLVGLFILGLKILVPKLKSIGTPVKLVLFALWIISVFVLCFLGLKQASQHAFSNQVYLSEQLPVQSKDTLYLNIENNSKLNSFPHYNDDFEIKTNQNGESILFSKDIRLIVNSTKDSIAQLDIIKNAVGPSFNEASGNAKKINYNFNYTNNTLNLDGFFTIPLETGYREQKVTVRLYLPQGTILYAGDKVYNYNHYKGLLSDTHNGHYIEINNNKVNCLDCPIIEKDSTFNANIKVEENQVKINIGKNGLHITTKETNN